MFETNAQFLSVIGEFAVIGLFLGLFCDIFRFLGTALGLGKIYDFISGFFAMIISGLALLFFSLDTPTGKVRIIYVIAAAVGIAFYMITIGKITKLIAKLAGKLLTIFKQQTKSLIYNPIIRILSAFKQKLTSFFVEIHQKTKKYTEKSHLGLKKSSSMMYNRNDKIRKLYPNGGEERNVIKAKVRKKA